MCHWCLHLLVRLDCAHEFTAALEERGRQGVRLYVLLDWIGGALDEGLLEGMRNAGVKIRRYNAPQWYNLDRLNHRKLMDQRATKRSSSSTV